MIEEHHIEELLKRIFKDFHLKAPQELDGRIKSDLERNIFIYRFDKGSNTYQKNNSLPYYCKKIIAIANPMYRHHFYFYNKRKDKDNRRKMRR